jgi:hypothetical protein
MYVWHLCLGHNLRLDAPNGGESKIDSTKSHLNVVLCGTPTREPLMAEVAARIAVLSTPPRINARIGIELLFSLPPEAAIDEVLYFRRCLVWARKYFEYPIISAVVHYDESCRHMHCLMLPIAQDSGILAGREKMGGIASINLMREDFYNCVARPHGLRKPKAKRPLSASVRREAMRVARSALEGIGGLSGALLDAIFRRGLDIEAVLAALEIPLPVEKVAGSFVNTMTRPIKARKKTALALQPAEASLPFCISRLPANDESASLVLADFPEPKSIHHSPGQSKSKGTYQ